MKRLHVIIGLILLQFGISNAQQKEPTVLDGIYVKEHVPARKPVPYHHLREADMMWSKKIWRILDLREKINHPIYYPVTDPVVDTRRSLISLMLFSVDNGELEVYDTGDDEFTTPMTVQQIDVAFDALDDTVMVENVETGEQVATPTKGTRKLAEVSRLMLKEVWYFDKQRAMLEVRIIGMCPIRLAPPKATLGEVEDPDEEKVLTQKKVMWVYFPSFRPIMARNEVFNPNNDSERRTYDDIFFKRRFSSYIFQETNVYDNRTIGEYRYGLDALLESEKIKDWMFKVEHDLWEF